MIEVYYAPPSLYGRKVLAVLMEKNLDYTIKAMSFMAGDHKKPEYLKLNPNGQIPTLVDEGVVIYESTAIAEYFRDRDKKVMLMMDSVTRFALAQREIGLAVGEPPTTRGYTPSVFSLLPKLLERAGTARKGSITGIYTVLVEGGDMDEPVADAVRGILDGHLVLSRDLAHQNIYPAVDILSSISRLMPEICNKAHFEMAGKLRNIYSTYVKNADAISLGAYKTGSDPKIDEAIQKEPLIESLIRQGINESVAYEKSIEALSKIVGHGG